MRLSILFFLLFVELCNAQQQTFDVSNPSGGYSGYVRYNNTAAIGQKNEDKFDYSEVRGSCFWDEEWNPAVLILRSGKGYKFNKVKLNFYTNNVHYIDDKGAELVAQNNLKNILFFDRNDTTKLIAVFKSLEGFKIKDVDSYAQILTDGKIRFLKRKEVKLIKKEVDPMLGRPDLRFISETHYYIEDNGRAIQLKVVNKANLFSIIKPEDGDEAWLKSNKNKLKNEADVIAFLTYRNHAEK